MTRKRQRSTPLATHAGLLLAVRISLAVVVTLLIICAVIGACEIYDAVRVMVTTENTSSAGEGPH